MRWLIEVILLWIALAFAARVLFPETDGPLGTDWRIGAAVILLAAMIASRRLLFGSRPKTTGKGAGKS